MKKFNMYEIISKKRDNFKLSKGELSFVIDGYLKDKIPDYQVSALLMAIYFNGMDADELEQLTRLMLNSGGRIDLKDIKGKKIDKHSTGGVGDKVSFVVAPLVAACGVKVPMLSGRALGHTGGTLDKLESIPGMNVFLSIEQFKEVLAKTGMAICGQTENIVPADKKLYALRDSSATVNSIPLISSSIMSKKLALGSDGIVLDVKTGSGAFMKSIDDSIELCRTMVEIGENNGRRTVGLITEMDQPLGNCVGNSLEIMESFECLKGKGPSDLMNVTYAVGAAMLVAAGRYETVNDSIDALKAAVKSGDGLRIFRDFIFAQNGDGSVCEDYSLLKQADMITPVKSLSTGFINSINAFEVGMAAIEAGAGREKKDDDVDHSSGFIFKKKSGNRVSKGETILEIHSDSKRKIDQIKKRLYAAMDISETPEPVPDRVTRFIDKTGVKNWKSLFG